MAVKLSLAFKQNSQSLADNKSNVTLTASVSWTYGSYNKTSRSGYVIIDGKQYNFTSSFNTGQTNSGSQTIFTKTVDVAHNADGSKTVAYSGSFSTGVSSGTITASGSKELTKIARQATITNAPNFNDEENPTITYSNPAGDAVDSVEAFIQNESGTITYAELRSIPKTGSSYTFNLTNEERTALRNAAANSNALTVKFALKTIINGNDLYSSLNKTLTIVNANPTLNPTIKDTLAASKTLTGDENKIIKGYNTISATSGGAALKGATIKSQKITCGETVINSGSGTFNNVETAAFTFSITDSRGNVTTRTVDKTLINYVKLSCNMNATISIAGEIDLNLAGNYFNDTFGAVANTLTAQYRYKELNGAYSDWTAATATLNGNKYTSNVKITGLDYRKTYIVQARVIDKLNTVTTAEKRLKAIPVFDWGENDFKFNVPVYDEKGVKLGSEITADNQTAVATSGKILQETGFVTITPKINTPTMAKIYFKRAYKKLPNVFLSFVSGVPGTNVLGCSYGNITTTSVDIYVTRINEVPTTINYFVFGEVAD